MPSEDVSYAAWLFKKLLDTVVDPYRKSKGLEWKELPLELYHEKKILVKDGPKPESKTLIEIPESFDSVIVIDDRYNDLGEQLREKLNELKKEVN